MSDLHFDNWAPWSIAEELNYLFWPTKLWFGFIFTGIHLERVTRQGAIHKFDLSWLLGLGQLFYFVFCLLPSLGFILSSATCWHWWCLSWQSGHFRHRRSAVWIPTSAKFYLPIVNQIEKMKIKKNRPGMAHLLKKRSATSSVNEAETVNKAW